MPNPAYPRPFWVPDIQNFAVAHEQDRHEEALWAFGEYAMFILMWRIEDHQAGLVTRCSTCYLGATAEAYGQAARNNCPNCFGSTFEGGFKAKLIRPALFNEDMPSNQQRQRGEVEPQNAQVESTSDFRLRTHDFIFRGDGTRWHVSEIRADLLTTGFSFDASVAESTSVGFNYASVQREDEASVAYLIPPTDADLKTILKVSPRYPSDMTAYEVIRGPLFPDPA